MVRIAVTAADRPGGVDAKETDVTLYVLVRGRGYPPCAGCPRPGFM